MRASIKLGKIFGIPLQLHYTWFIIFTLVTISLVFYFSSDYPVIERIAFGILTSILFFASIIIHELAHSVLAIRNGIPVKKITLFVFGGISHITKEATHPKAELLIAVVGPLASLVMGGIFYGLSILLTQAQQILIAHSMQWLAIINVILALFNLIPGFPLDGGRVFRAIIWRKTGNYHQATHIATKVGQGIAYAFMIGGLAFIFVTHIWLNGLWLIFIGWFLRDAARASYQQALLCDSLSGVTVHHVTNYGCPLIPPELSLRELAQNYILPTGRSSFPVAREAILEGIVTLHDIKKVPQTRWDATTVRDIMTPANKLKTAHPNQDILSLLQQMEGVDHIPVVERGKVIGIVNREDLNRFLRIRTTLEAKLRT